MERFNESIRRLSSSMQIMRQHIDAMQEKAQRDKIIRLVLLAYGMTASAIIVLLSVL